ncbi:MAG: hypothetical protein AB7V56_16280 [Candidatus Nitrosocosmicus sp.]|jgi:hypothetical protein|uniref:hypothetical protein n=1 Tax=Candidatus Nitrosocosmicus agrestis TaxID=2563600 RepID=UPI00122E8EF6|nr:hypothetical protein [Candidatus Nitrosocosmicus sp. SS]KAA2280098.1 hypothetical protein F1Z66_12090 [Candidatus Nitrosocosmicus sp. SS]KAF0868279.1 hypothetical protein E5N71_10760 [Candidatus Nitrosocosmicus sp. SS]MDR4492559.1 hypothetical protein [Candidatus Nitrosocosmicus sp.]HET6591092.1 hypothetical protein [Candidatus Nitrosocosmicus sp.]
MTKMFNVNIDAEGFDQNEAQEWVNEMGNVYADMEVSDVNVSGNKISFKAGFSGMDDTSEDDIRMKLDEYMTMHELFQAKNVSVTA